MFLSSLFIILGVAAAQPAADIPVQTTEYISGTRYEFEHQEKEYIVDLSENQQIVALYIDNNLQNPNSIGLEKKYHEKTKNDLLERFYNSRGITGQRRTRRVVVTVPWAVSRLILLWAAWMSSSSSNNNNNNGPNLFDLLDLLQTDEDRR